MNEFRFEVEIARTEGAPADVIRERVYGEVRVHAEWPAQLATPEIRLAVEVRGDVDRRDAPAYVELFFHDVFLLLNLASVGSFGGTVSITGGELRARELVFHPRLFEYASPLERLPIERVARWYDGLQLGTRQIANGAEAAAMFHLLCLGRSDEDEERSIVRLAQAADALIGRPRSLRRLFELRDDITHGRTPVFHPMHDDALDASVEDATRDWLEVADAAATAVISALQERIRKA